MKRSISFLLSLVAIFSMGLSFGCQGTGNVQPPVATKVRIPEKYKTNAWRQKSDTEYFIADYEHACEFNCIDIISSKFGTLTISSEYKTSGESSVKIEVIGHGVVNAATQERPGFTVFTKDTNGDDDNPYVDAGIDLSVYRKVAFDIYNPMEQDSYLMLYIDGAQPQVTIPIEKGWNNIELDLDSNDTWKALQELRRFDFYFQRYEAFGGIQTYYLDNFRMVK